MSRLRKLAIPIFILALGGLLLPLPVQSDEADSLDGQLKETKQEITQTEEEKSEAENKLKETKGKEEQLAGSITYYEFQLSVTQQQLQQMLAEIDQKETGIKENLAALNEQENDLNLQKERLAEQIRLLYKSSFTNPLEIYFSLGNEMDAARLLVFHQAVIKNLRQKVILLAEQIEVLNEKRQLLENELKNLESERQDLLCRKQETEQDIDQAEKKVLSARAEQQQLMQELAGLSNRLQELTRKEQEILARKAAAALAATTVGEIEISRAAISSPPPQDGNIYFSFWTYGYPHRVGMNQYGAYGRAKSGQGYKEIISAYYQGVKIEEREVPGNIKIIDGDIVREIAFEDDYLLGIGEMPSCWGSEESGGLEALKAQAVAARTYALKYTDNGRAPICITQKCQVYIGSSKTTKMCGQFWQKAVEETRGVVITYGGEPISAWYASTAGGFTLSSQEVWGGATPYTRSIKDADAGGDYYDGPQWGNSPWFHKCWGDVPWLSREQVEDLINASRLPASYDAHLPAAENDGYSTEEVFEILQKEGIGTITNLKAIEIIGEETASSLLVRVFHDESYTDLDAQRFRFVFNLRSPGTDAIWTSRFDVATS